MLGEDDDTTATVGIIWAGRGAAPFGGLACFQRHHVGVGGPDRQRRGDAGQHIDSIQMAMQQQHLDERPGACTITVGFAGGNPKRLMLGGERLRCAGLRQRCGARQSPGLALIAGSVPEIQF